MMFKIFVTWLSGPKKFLGPSRNGSLVWSGSVRNIWFQSGLVKTRSFCVVFQFPHSLRSKGKYMYQGTKVNQDAWLLSRIEIHQIN